LSANLEFLGKAGDMAAVHALLPEFTRCLSELVEGILFALEGAVETTQGGPPADLSAAAPLFEELSGALKAQKIETINYVLDELMRQPLDLKTKKMLEQVSDYILVTEFDEALEIVDGILK